MAVEILLYPIKMSNDEPPIVLISFSSKQEIGNQTMWSLFRDNTKKTSAPRSGGPADA